jgi:hypothetical protein
VNRGPKLVGFRAVVSGGWIGSPGSDRRGDSRRRLKAETYALYLAYRHPRTPWYAKVFALIVGYVFSPIDPIPDFIPVVGLLDEIVVVRSRSSSPGR